MDLSQKSNENVQFMIQEIIKKLRMATASAIKPDHFNENHYEDIKDIYGLIMNSQNISISEMEAIVSELGKLRKS